jgi:quinohemoprotein ethanol dehydrogenase
MICLASPYIRQKSSATAATQRSPLGFLMVASVMTALTCFSSASAQSPAKGSPEHIKAVTSAVDQIDRGQRGHVERLACCRPRLR